MVITDSQVHGWGADTPDWPWPLGCSHLAQKPYPVTKEMLVKAMDEAGVARVVIVPPSWEGDRNDLALEAARLHPDRFAVMGRLAVEKPESRALHEPALAVLLPPGRDDVQRRAAVVEGRRPRRSHGARVLGVARLAGGRIA